MKTLFPVIEKKQKELTNSRFLQWLGDSRVNVQACLAHIPAMAFFVFGFKDILCHAKINAPKSPLESAITLHCEEDAYHWKWFLSDLEKLGFYYPHKNYQETIRSLFLTHFGDETKDVRDMVYSCMYYVKSSKDPLIHLALIEILEAAFGAYSIPMKKLVKQAGFYEELEYFGKKHVEAEESHEAGSWTAGANVHQSLYQFELSDESRVFAHEMVNDLFESFHQMFENWFQQGQDSPSLSFTNPQQQSQPHHKQMAQ